MPLGNDSIMDPQLTDAVLRMRDDISRSINCVKVGQIQSFDGSRRTAEIQILFKRVLPDGSVGRYPLLVDCPVFTLQGGAGFLGFPIQTGDQCLVMFADRNLDIWFQNGSEAAPANSRAHDLSDGIALVGLNSLASTGFSISGSDVQLVHGDSTIEMDTDKIAIKNATTSLITLIDGFIDVLKAISTVPGGGPLNAASIAALEAQKAIFGGLLKP